MLGLLTELRQVEVKPVVNITIGRGYDDRPDEPEGKVVEGEVTSVESGGQRWVRSFPRYGASGQACNLFRNGPAARFGTHLRGLPAHPLRWSADSLHPSC